MDDAADIRIGSKVRSLREDAQMSALELGAHLEIDAEAVLSIERGVMRAGITLLDRLGAIFAVPVWSFFEATTETSAAQCATSYRQ